MLHILEKASLLHGKDEGVDASAMATNAAMKRPVPRDRGESYQEVLVAWQRQAAAGRADPGPSLWTLTAGARAKRHPTGTGNRSGTRQRAEPN